MSSSNPVYAQENVRLEAVLGQLMWIIRDGLRQPDPSDLKDGNISYERLFEGGRVGTLIQVVNDNGGITIVPETHTDLIMYSQQECLRPIVDPVPTRSISLIIRADYIHETKLNAVVDAVRRIIPVSLLENTARRGNLRL